MYRNPNRVSHRALWPQERRSGVQYTLPSLPSSFRVRLFRHDLQKGIGGNAIEEAHPDKQQLLKGFQAQFWLGFASAVVGAAIALILKIGRRGTSAEVREGRIAKKALEENQAAADVKLAQEGEIVQDKAM